MVYVAFVRRVVSVGKLSRCPGALLHPSCRRSVRFVASSSNSDSYQFMQRSKLPTMHFQPSLPRLPIPLLQKTCERFVASAQPILSEEKLTQTKQMVAEFQQGVGMHLHALLKQSDAANKHTSYISEPWFDMYLSDRAPLPLNYNPLLVMKNETRPEYQSQLVRATNLVVSSLRFWRSLQAGLLEPEVYHISPQKSDTENFRRWMRLAPKSVATYAAYAFKAFPLDMSQYNRLFGVSRIPEPGKDRLVQSSDSKHILVMRRGNMYAVNVLDNDGNVETPAVIFARLSALQRLDEEYGVAPVALGVLTAGNRDEWAQTRRHLETGICAANRHLLQHEVDPALFCICLDGADDPAYEEHNPIPSFKHLLGGKAKNRWFDKSVSLLLGADGTAAINFEHSWGDGVAVLRYFNEIYKETTESPWLDSSAEAPSTSCDEAVRHLNFELDDRVRVEVERAMVKNDKIMESLNMQILRYPHINKMSCKRDGISPDSIMQLSFQLAYRQAFGRYVGTYESCSTAAFRHGRTEAMRPCTMATRQFCDALLLPAANRPDAMQLRDMIAQCSRAHGQLTKEAAMGQGFDRHLFAMKHMALLNGIPVPELYASEAYQTINYNIMSTSTLWSNALLVGTFGPVVRDGLGIGYAINNEECGAIVTSYEHQGDGQSFLNSLEEAFRQIRHVIDASSK